VFSVDYKGFDKHQIKSLNQVGKMVKDNGGSFVDFKYLANHLSKA